MNVTTSLILSIRLLSISLTFGSLSATTVLFARRRTRALAKTWFGSVLVTRPSSTMITMRVRAFVLLAHIRLVMDIIDATARPQDRSSNLLVEIAPAKLSIKLWVLFGSLLNALAYILLGLHSGLVNEWKYVNVFSRLSVAHLLKNVWWKNEHLTQDDEI